MSEEPITPADEKALALNFALTAVIKTLIDSDVMDRDHLFRNLAGAQQQLQRLEEFGAASFLASLNEGWLGI